MEANSLIEGARDEPVDALRNQRHLDDRTDEDLAVARDRGGNGSPHRPLAKGDARAGLDADTIKQLDEMRDFQRWQDEMDGYYGNEGAINLESWGDIDHPDGPQGLLGTGTFAASGASMPTKSLMKTGGLPTPGGPSQNRNSVAFRLNTEEIDDNYDDENEANLESSTAPAPPGGALKGLMTSDQLAIYQNPISVRAQSSLRNGRATSPSLKLSPRAARRQAEAMKIANAAGGRSGSAPAGLFGSRSGKLKVSVKYSDLFENNLDYEDMPCSGTYIDPVQEQNRILASAKSLLVEDDTEEAGNSIPEPEESAAVVFNARDFMGARADSMPLSPEERKQLAAEANKSLVGNSEGGAGKN